MAQIIYSEAALADFERLTEFLAEESQTEAERTVELIIQAISILEHHPLIGRPVNGPLRELVISRGRSGYLAMYSLERNESIALVLRIRHQMEAGYA